MISDVKNYPISQLFDIETNVVYAIPPYQREYTWGKREWEALFDDIAERVRQGDAPRIQELWNS